MQTYRPDSYNVVIRGTVGITTKLDAEVSLTIVLQNPCPLSSLTATSELGIGNLLYALGTEPIEFGFYPSELV